MFGPEKTPHPIPSEDEQGQFGMQFEQNLSSSQEDSRSPEELQSEINRLRAQADDMRRRQSDTAGATELEEYANQLEETLKKKTN